MRFLDNFVRLYRLLPPAVYGDNWHFLLLCNPRGEQQCSSFFLHITEWIFYKSPNSFSTNCRMNFLQMAK